MVKVQISLGIGYTERDIKNAIIRLLPVEKEEIREIRILRSSLDLSDKSNINYKLSLGVSFSAEREAGLLKMKKKVAPLAELDFEIPKATPPSRPVVVGSGPCGLFATLLLAKAGARPILLERGLSVEERGKRVEKFSRFGILDPECNVQFGEGGAGTYSDGKLKVGSLDKYKVEVLNEFVLAGATADIMHSATAHLGTDRLPAIVKNLRQKLISLGAEVIFGACMTALSVKDGRLVGVYYTKDGNEELISTTDVILAIGHSARDSIRRLYSDGVKMEAKGFGIGVRIEHPREYINDLVYGKGYDRRLESASYHLVTHLDNGRSVYSFCMCPGGTVVPAASEEGGIVTNGMSEYNRDADNSNAAFLVSLTPKDFGSEDALAGFTLQRQIEECVFHLTDSTYKAPVMRMEDFVKGNAPTHVGSVKPSYPIGTVAMDMGKCLPEYISESLRQSISDFDAWMPGFYMPDAVLTAAETRSTSPVRMLRRPDYQAMSIDGLYPAGEGAGYSGGIVSSAIDGIKCAEALLLK